MKTIDRVYSVTLHFDENAPDPDKLFAAYAKVIASTRSVEFLIAKTISRTVRHQQFLSSVTPGSIISKIKETFEFSDDSINETADVPIAPPLLQDYMQKSRNAVLDGMRSGSITTGDQVNAIRDKITEIARATGFEQRFSYTPPAPTEIIDVVKSVSEATQNLSVSESLTISEEQGSDTVTIPMNVVVDVTRLEKDLVRNIITNNRQIILKIKKPDYLGEARWVFKHGKNTIEAKINDEEWLTRFHKKLEPISPGDSIEVKAEMIEEYDRHGNLLKESYTVQKIISVIPGSIDEDEQRD